MNLNSVKIFGSGIGGDTVDQGNARPGRDPKNFDAVKRSDITFEMLQTYDKPRGSSLRNISNLYCDKLTESRDSIFKLRKEVFNEVNTYLKTSVNSKTAS